MKVKKIISIFIIIIIAVTLVNKLYVKEIDKSQIDVNKYIEVTDRVSGNEAQVNWKEVAAIVATLNNNKFKNMPQDEIEEVASLFVKADSSVNSKIEEMKKINSMNEVMEILDFKDKEKRVAIGYLNDLDDFGLIPERLKKDTKYVKFIESIKEDSIINYKEYKILPSITIAQAILESSWGESSLSNKYNNLFGIKADSSWKGEYVTLETLEHKDTMVNSKFRKYDNRGTSIKDHAEFLYKNKRYRENGVFDANTYINQAKALEKAGYSTAVDEHGNKVYAKRLIDLIRQYNLQLIDCEVDR